MLYMKLHARIMNGTGNMKMVDTGKQHWAKTKIKKGQGDVQNALDHSNAKIKDV